MTTPWGGQLYRTVHAAKIKLLQETGLNAHTLVCHPYDPQRGDLLIIAQRLDLVLNPTWSCEPDTLYVLPKE